MKKSIIYSLFALVTLMGWSACSDDDNIVSKNTVEVQLNLAVPANDFETRAPGDPGVYEEFPEPHFIYVFLVLSESNIQYRVLQDVVSWNRAGDYYVSTGRFNLEVENIGSDVVKPEAYILASPKAIRWTFSGYWQKEENVKKDSKTDVLNKIFLSQTYDDGSKINLRDIYSTPYNLLNADNEYYGTGTVFGSTDPNNNTGKPVIAFGSSKNKLTLYRVAAKVDFQWEAEDHNTTNTIKEIEIFNVPTSGYAFKPVGNVSGVSYNGYAPMKVFSESEVNEGNKWEGRAYTYMLQPENYSLTYKVTTEQGSKTVTTSETGMNKSEIYSAWYMIRLNLK